MSSFVEPGRRALGVLSIRWRLFILMGGSIAVLVTVLTMHSSHEQSAAREAALATKATLVAATLAVECGPALAFDDTQTAREVFAAAATDPDVAALALYRSDGTLLEGRGEVDHHITVPRSGAVLERRAASIRIVALLTTPEGPSGVLLVEVSSARLVAEIARLRQTSLAVGLLVLAVGLTAAWVVGRSVGRRLGRVEALARKVIAGDLHEAPLVDSSGDEIGQLARAFHVMVGVVERKVHERTVALEASREQYRTLVETARTVPWRLLGPAWQFSYVGPQAAAMFGGEAAAWLTPGFWQARVRAEDLAGVAAALLRASAERSDQETEFRFRLDDGRERWIRMMIGAPAAGGATSGFMFDVTERRVLELELRQAQKLESVGRLAAGVAHEINTPIQFVSDSVTFMKTAFADLQPLFDHYAQVRAALAERGRAEEAAALLEAEARADLPYLREELPRAIERSLDGLERVTTIVKSMKEFAHPASREQALADLNTALASTLVIACNEYKYVADVETRLGDVPSVLCHVGELNQVFLNILVNAAHAISDVVQGTDRRGRIEVTTTRQGDDVVVSIGDTGGGIPEAIRANIFDPFFTTKGVGRGTGQGLAIARRIVEKHGGTLTFDSELGRGTTFFIRVPVRPPAESASRAA
jgi:PAS domain S-box-containing protein